MEVEEIQKQPFKLSRTGNGRSQSNKIGQTAEQYQDEDEEDGEGGGGGGGVGVGSNVGNEGGRLRGWPSSRIIRVSRASGGKDRHSKVWTARGPRDRRVRLSVSTAIQFYDLQDRLGYDQPSKAVEWLIKAAEDAIAELPSLNNAFPETPKQPSDEKRRSPSETRFDHPEVELEADPNYQQQQPISLSKSASSTSDTSKGSVYSLSRSEIRVKARERARERTANEKVKEKEESHVAYQQNLNTTSRTSSFTELLTGGGGGTPSNNGNSNNASAQQNAGGGHSFIHRPIGQLSSSPMDYFGVGLFGQSASRAQPSSGYSSQTLFGNPQPHSMTVSPQFNVTGDHHPELQQFSFLPDNLMPVSPAAGSDYNLNFTISSGLAGFNRGTLQSNSPSPLPHLQRFPSPVDGPNVPFFMGTAASAAVAVDNNHFPAGFDGRLQLYYGDGCRHPDLKGKGKN